MIRIAICDDELIYLEKNQNVIDSILKAKKIFANISVYQNSSYLLEDIEEKVFFDLLFLDIEMPNTNGIELSKLIKTYLPNVLIVFITSHTEYIYDSFELAIFRFIPKDELELRIEPIILDAAKHILLESNDFYLIETQNRIEKIAYKDIYYLKKSGKNSIIVNYNGESKVRKSLNDVFSELNSSDFVYIDRGCIVNILHIMRFYNSEIELKNGTWLAVSRSNRKEIKNILNEFWGSKI